MPRRGRKRKKTRTHVIETDERITSALQSSEELKIPRSLVTRVIRFTLPDRVQTQDESGFGFER